MEGIIVDHDEFFFDGGGPPVEQHIGNVILKGGEIFIKPDAEAQPVHGEQNRQSVGKLLCDVGAIVLTIFVLGSAIIIPIAMIVFGARGMGECPVEKMIPVYLLVGGIAFVVITPIAFIIKIWENCVTSDGPMALCLKCYNGLFFNSIAVFLLVWFICGNVWVFRVKNVEFSNQLSPDYCNEETYRFAFWVIIATYICAVLSCLFTSCIRKHNDSYNEVK